MQNQFLTEESKRQPRIPEVTSPEAPEILEMEQSRSVEVRERQQEQAVAEFVAKWKKRARRRPVILPLAVLTSAVSLLLWRLHPSGIGALIAAVLFGSSMLYTLMVALTAQRETGNAIQDLVRTGGIRAIGPLIEMRLGFMNGAQIEATYDAMIELLPQFTFQDSPLLSRKHRHFLYEVLEGMGQIGLSAEKQQQLRLAILEALKEVGDAEAVRIVRQLAKVPRWPKRPDAIQQAAQEALPLLEANLAYSLSAQTLLRASTMETEGAHTLLRPASSSTKHEPNKLLRAANKPLP